MHTASHSPRRRNYLGDASLWWDNWVPVAATGWGALVVIAPMLAADFLIRAIRGPSGQDPAPDHMSDPPESDDPRLTSNLSVSQRYCTAGGTGDCW
ncbi:hypothetical protein [Dietzia kunjamensis]|uniref:hypothetical protein n=1 Tax=Dietzia kunjamensis TaxID=322509 RepID=UPI0020985C11|nr:hypothetical protein [Dietzia kunjamensis]USX44664.1 hypothetical protein NHB83_10235 [Dietzia kunjamensis]